MARIPASRRCSSPGNTFSERKVAVYSVFRSDWNIFLAFGVIGTDDPGGYVPGDPGPVRSIRMVHSGASGSQGYTREARSQPKINSTASRTSLKVRSMSPSPRKIRLTLSMFSK